MKVTITTDEGEVLNVYKVVEKMPDEDADHDAIDITDADDLLDIELIEQTYWSERGIVDAAVLSLWKSGRR